MSIGVILIITLLGCTGNGSTNGPTPDSGSTVTSTSEAKYPKIASWVAKKDEIIKSKKPYDFIMGDWFTAEEAQMIRSQNPTIKILAGAAISWVNEDKSYINYLETLGNLGASKKIEISDEMYLKKPNGEKCPFGWASDEFQQKEFYVMDPRNPQWIGLMTSFYENILAQPHHDGITFDMVSETSPCPEAISDKEWLEATKEFMEGIKNINTKKKLVIINSGGYLSLIDEYSEYFDGFVLEKFLGKPFKKGWPSGANFQQGLVDTQSGKITIYAVDTDDTGIKDMNRMRLGLTLSLLNDNTYFIYDFGPRNHGQAWWFPEYDANLGVPLGTYCEKDNAYWREFENGIVVSSPDTDVTVTFDTIHTDITTNEKSQTFEISQGDGRIFIKSNS